MGTCDLGLDHPEPEPVIVDTSGEAIAAEAGAAAGIEIARIGADRDVAVAKIEARQADAESAATMAALMARIDVLEQWQTAQMPPEPEPVVIPVADPAPSPDDNSDSPPDILPPPRSTKDKGWWGGYRK